MATYRVEQVDKYDPTDWEWAVVAEDGSVVDRYETRETAERELPSYDLTKGDK